MTETNIRLAGRLGGRRFGADPAGAYKFEAVKRGKAEFRAARPELPLLDFGVGEPDRAADPALVARLAAEAGRPANRFYADNGIGEFQDAAAAYLAAAFGARGLDPRRQIVHGIGSKSMLAMLPLCLVDPGDWLLCTVPGYPVCATHARYLGGRVWPLPLRAEADFLPDLDAVPRRVLARAKALYFNYPNNPTGACAPPEFFDRLIAWAARRRIALIHDAAYAELRLDGRPPLSLLARPGGAESGVELHSLSKCRNMTGWRLGFMAGDPRLVAAYAAVKGNSDSGQFRAIQLAGAQALADAEAGPANAARYGRRFDLLVPALRRLGFAARKPDAGFYCYCPAPRGRTGPDGVRRPFADAAAAADCLLREAGVSTVPWDDAGPHLRWSATFEAEGPAGEREAVAELERRLAALGLWFD